MSAEIPTTPEPTDYVPNTILDSIDDELNEIFDEAVKEGYGPDSANKDQVALLDKKELELLEQMYNTPDGEVGDPDLNDALTEVHERATSLRAHLNRRGITI